MKRTEIWRTAAAMAASALAITGAVVWQNHEAARKIYHFKNGLTVEVLPIEPNEMADFFSVNRWKFHITMPPHTNMLKANMEVWHGDKAFPPRQGWFSVPTYGKDFDAFVYLRTEDDEAKNVPKIKAVYKYGAATMRTEMKNPFYADTKPVTFAMSVNNTPMETEDDGFVLMQGYPQSSRPNDPANFGPYEPERMVKLVLKWTPDYMKGAGEGPNTPNPGFWQSFFARTN